MNANKITANMSGSLKKSVKNPVIKANEPINPMNKKQRVRLTMPLNVNLAFANKLNVAATKNASKLASALVAPMAAIAQKNQSVNQCIKYAN